MDDDAEIPDDVAARILAWAARFTDGRAVMLQSETPGLWMQWGYDKTSGIFTHQVIRLDIEGDRTVETILDEAQYDLDTLLAFYVWLDSAVTRSIEYRKTFDPIHLGM